VDGKTGFHKKRATQTEETNLKNTKQIIETARMLHIAVPALNVPYPPMVQPVIAAVRDENAFALVELARVEWEKFGAISLETISDEYSRWNDERHVRLHLDHVPVIDEDHKPVDYIDIVRRAIAAGYQSVMVDGSRLSLEENIRATAEVALLAHAAGLPCEAELGAVMGHEDGPMPPYEELLASGMGFTKVEEAVRFVHESGCDWLSVAIGNIHGAISEATRGQAKPQARLDIAHLKKLQQATGIPLVLHGGSGIRKESIQEAVQNGIVKINVGTEIRQAYENGVQQGGIEMGQKMLYESTRAMLRDFFEISGSADRIDALGD
jgi:ketose-bisphosphate aldolase